MIYNLFAMAESGTDNKLIINSQDISSRRKIIIRKEDLPQTPEEKVKAEYEQLQELKRQVDKLLTPEARIAIHHLSRRNIFGYYANLDKLPLEHKSNRRALEQLADLQTRQHELARALTGNIVEFYAKTAGIDESNMRCVYWAGAHDTFDKGFPGWWKHVGLEEPNQPRIVLKGISELIEFDVRNSGLPEGIEKQSIPVSLFKTLGSAPDEIRDGFWRKIMESTKEGGLIITTEPLPEEAAKQTTTFDELNKLIGNTRIELNAPFASSNIGNGYYASEYDFLIKK